MMSFRLRHTGKSRIPPDHVGPCVMGTPRQEIARMNSRKCFRPTIQPLAISHLKKSDYGLRFRWVSIKSIFTFQTRAVVVLFQQAWFSFLVPFSHPLISVSFSVETAEEHVSAIPSIVLMPYDNPHVLPSFAMGCAFDISNT